ncbi:UNVERIFIED_CONTAM: hypothetical protein PYX00_008839 [Menopon gallinae]|uniref:Uncharacterized protein n=1 Tax=Menopon gallinae TaxID=328185 RepID=A0AAW2H904_9NEOP
MHAPIVWLRFEAAQNTFVKTSSIRMSGGKRPRGRPRQGWLRKMKALAENRLVIPGSLQEIAEHRAKWKSFVASLMLTQKRVP